MSLTRESFAVAMNVTSRTVSNWLAQGRVPGARKIRARDVAADVWRIPERALQMEKPRRGRKKTAVGFSSRLGTK